MGILLQDISSQNLLSRDISSQTFLHGNFVTGYFVTNPIWWIACNLGILSVLTVLAYDCKMASRENRSNVGPTWRSSGSVLCLSEILTSYVIRLFEISIFTEFKGGISKYRHPALRHWGTPAPILKLLNCRFLIFHAQKFGQGHGYQCEWVWVCVCARVCGCGCVYVCMYVV